MPNGGFAPIFLQRKGKIMMVEQLRVVKRTGGAVRLGAALGSVCGRTGAGEAVIFG